MLVTILDRQSTGNHVAVIDGLHFVYIISGKDIGLAGRLYSCATIQQCRHYTLFAYSEGQYSSTALLCNYALESAFHSKKLNINNHFIFTVLTPKL